MSTSVLPVLSCLLPDVLQRGEPGFPAHLFPETS